MSDEEIHGLDLLGFPNILHRKGELDAAQKACAQAVDSGYPSNFTRGRNTIWR